MEVGTVNITANGGIIVNQTENEDIHTCENLLTNDGINLVDNIVRNDEDEKEKEVVVDDNNDYDAVFREDPNSYHTQSY